MAAKLNNSATLEKAEMDGAIAAIGNAALLYIYSGTQPSGTAGADGTLAAGPFTCGSPFAPAASSALPSVVSPTLPSNVNASASIQPTWWRVKTSGGTPMQDGSAGTSGCDMTIGPTTSGQPVAIAAWGFNSATFGH
jgi:hypothetical protein